MQHTRRVPFTLKNSERRGTGMKKTNWLLSVIVLGMGLVVQTAAQQAVLKHRGTLRKDPSSKNPPIMRLDAGIDVDLIDPTPTRGYYHVRTSDPEVEGWIYSRSIDILATTAPVATPTPTAPTPGTPPTSPSGVASAFSPDWEKPAPNSTTFAGPDGDCGPTGDGGDSFTNARKNRSDDATRSSRGNLEGIAVAALPCTCGSI